MTKKIHKKKAAPVEEEQVKGFRGFTKGLVAKILVIYAIITVAALLWTQFVTGWEKPFWVFLLW